MSKHRPFHRGHRRAECIAADATLAALVQPAAAMNQSETFRDDVRDAMLREFDRAAAPRRDRPTPEPVPAAARAHVVTVEGVTLTNLESIEDPAGAAEKVRAILARRRATQR